MLSRFLKQLVQISGLFMNSTPSWSPRIRMIALACPSACIRLTMSKPSPCIEAAGP